MEDTSNRKGPNMNNKNYRTRIVNNENSEALGNIKLKTNQYHNHNQPKNVVKEPGL